MERTKGNAATGGGAPKKKIIDDIDTARRRRATLTEFISRPGCHTCDRSEAGFQISKIDAAISALERNMRILENN